MKQRMKREIAAVWFAAAVGAVAVLPARGAPPATATAPASATSASQEAAALAEEIAVLRALKPLRPAPDQLAVLTAAVTQAQERLAQQAQMDQRALAALRDSTVRARQQLLPERVNLDDPQIAAALSADQPVTNAQRAAEQNQAGLRDELAAGLRQQFQTLLTPAQAAAIVAQGRAMLVAEQAEQEKQRQQRQQQGQQAAGARSAAGGAPGAGRPGGRRVRGRPGTTGVRR